MKKPEEVMEILEAYDLAGSLRGAALLAGCDHKTVAHWVAQRDRGTLPKPERQRPVMHVDSGRRSMSWWSDRAARSGRMSRTAS